MIVDYISEHKERFGVEPICRVLSESFGPGCAIAPSTYYDVLNRMNGNRQPSKRKLSDAALKKVIETERKNNRFVSLFGSARCGCTCARSATKWLAAQSSG